jgi:uncharacterized protein YjbJ (UPF0337 family)
MNKDRVKGTIDEVVGGAKRKAGELTGDAQLQVEGMVQQVKGKVENVVGKTRDAIHEANREAEVTHAARVSVVIDSSSTGPHDNKTT